MQWNRDYGRKTPQTARKSRHLLNDPHNLKLKVIKMAIKSRNVGKIRKYTMLVKYF